MVITPAGLLIAMAICFLFKLPPWLVLTIEAVLFALFIFSLAFFRDPNREIPKGDEFFVSPADGTVADIETLDSVDGFDSPVLRIGIFLSVFNVHINRAPCKVKVEDIRYKPGKFLDARDKRAGRENEANDLLLIRTIEPADKIMVRQISGAIARRIVCAARPGDVLGSGEKFGMIKFGSRTELYIPARGDVKCEIKLGDKVKAGSTILAGYV